jgi:peptidoglycan/xylan/chitin deacetylase (PgdA/CDA1 family)
MNGASRSLCVTIDVEDFFLPRPPGYDTVFAATPEGEFGIGLMMDVLERHGARATFFIDAYNRTTLDEAVLARAARAVVERGHEAGLHTHPAFPSGRRGYGMRQVLSNHDRAWQSAFIRRGAEFLRAWTGLEVTSHRAGGYGANLDTLHGLRENGIAIDASLLHGYAGCALAAASPLRNRPHAIAGVLEVPVSVTRNRFLLRVAGVELQAFAMTQKIDIDWLDLPELKAQVTALFEAGAGTVVFFLHSYSFLRIGRGFRPHRANVAKFDELLAWLRDIPGVRLETLSAAARNVPAGDAAAPDPLPQCTFHLDRDWLRWVRWAAGTARPAHARLVLEHVKSRVRG